MDHYMTVGARDQVASVTFYDAALGAIGWARHADVAGWSCYSQGGTGGGIVLFVGAPFDGAEPSAGNGQMIGFISPSREQVDAFYTAALEAGGSCAGAPGERTRYGPGVYAAYVRDPSGNKMSAVHRG